MSVYALNDCVPEIAESVWVAGSATVLGKVSLAENTSVWFCAVLRGDNELISIGAGSNIQDGAVLHTDMGKPLIVGENVTVGHLAMLHGCEIGDESLIGIGATLLNGSKIGRHSLVGANALVTEGKHFPDGSMILGSPAKVVRSLSPDEIASIQKSAQIYIQNAQRFSLGLKEVSKVFCTKTNTSKWK